VAAHYEELYGSTAKEASVVARINVLATTPYCVIAETVQRTSSQQRKRPSMTMGIAGGFNKTFSITGQPPANRVLILQFENMDKVKGWREAARDAQEKIGNKYATFRTFAVEGVMQR